MTAVIKMKDIKNCFEYRQKNKSGGTPLLDQIV